MNQTKGKAQNSLLSNMFKKNGSAKNASCGVASCELRVASCSCELPKLEMRNSSQDTVIIYIN